MRRRRKKYSAFYNLTEDQAIFLCGVLSNKAYYARIYKMSAPKDMWFSLRVYDTVYRSRNMYPPRKKAITAAIEAFRDLKEFATAIKDII